MPPPGEVPKPHEPPLLDRPDEERLAQQIRKLQHELEEVRKRNQEFRSGKTFRKTHRKRWIVALAAATLIAAFLAGFVPHYRREKQLAEDTKARQERLPVLNFVVAMRSPPNAQITLPGSMQGLSDTPILARADGYLAKWTADIGDHVKKNQVIAVIAAPDLDQQVQQARAQVLQADAALKQAQANLDQGLANLALADVTAKRYAALLTDGAVARQDYDQQETNYKAQIATVNALNQAVGAADQNARAARANLGRLVELQQFEQVRAPFNGVITLRNIDVGALITTGTTLLYREAQVGRLRTYIYVPESNAPMVQMNQPATLLVAAFPSRKFDGVVTHTADSVDPATRTMLAEVQVPNPDGTLLPGMYAQVVLTNSRPNPPILIPADSLIIRANGLFVGVLVNEQPAQPLPAYTVRLVPVNVGRDYGNEIEILSGLNDGDRVVLNPGDATQDGSRVKGQESKPSTEPGSQPGQINVDMERLAPQPGAQQNSGHPMKETPTRGPGK